MIFSHYGQTGGSIAAQADDLIQQLRLAWARGLATLGPFDLTAQAAAVRKAYKDLGDRIDNWATAIRSQAEQGQKASGVPYSWQDWVDYGDELRRDMQYQLGISVEGSQWTAVSGALKSSAVTVATVAEKAAGAAPSFAIIAGVLGLLYVISAFRR